MKLKTVKQGEKTKPKSDCFVNEIDKSLARLTIKKKQGTTNITNERGVIIASPLDIKRLIRSIMNNSMNTNLKTQMK